MELHEYLVALRKRWYVIALLAVLGGALGLTMATDATPMYKATTKSFVSLRGGQTAGELLQGSTFVQNSIQSFVQLAGMPVVLDPVIQQLGLDTTASRLAGSVSATSPLNTYIIQISVVDTEPHRAAEIANAVGLQLASTVERLAPSSGLNGDTITLSTVAPASAPSAPFAPNKRMLVAGGTGLGLVLGLAVALASAALDTRVRNAGELSKLTGYPVLGTVRRARDSRGAQTTVLDDPLSTRAEGFRRVQTNLRYLDPGMHIKSLVVSSATAAEGKTATAINLALAVAEKGTSVLLVDADLRRPALADVLGIESSAGLTTILIGRASLEDVTRPWGHHNLHVLPSGEIPPNPSQLLDSDALRELVAKAVQDYDLVIFDTAPCLPVVDASVLARATDGVLMVVGLRKARRQHVREALESLEAVGAHVLGVVATGAKGPSDASAYTYAAHGTANPRGIRRLFSRTTTPSRPPATAAPPTPRLTAMPSVSPVKPDVAPTHVHGPHATGMHEEPEDVSAGDPL